MFRPSLIKVIYFQIKSVKSDQMILKSNYELLELCWQKAKPNNFTGLGIRLCKTWPMSLSVTLRSTSNVCQSSHIRGRTGIQLAWRTLLSEVNQDSSEVWKRESNEIINSELLAGNFSVSSSPDSGLSAPGDFKLVLVDVLTNGPSCFREVCSSQAGACPLQIPPQTLLLENPRPRIERPPASPNPTKVPKEQKMVFCSARQRMASGCIQCPSSLDVNPGLTLRDTPNWREPSMARLPTLKLCTHWPDFEDNHRHSHHDHPLSHQQNN